MSNPGPTSTQINGSTLQTSALKSRRSFLDPANLGQVSLGLVNVGQRPTPTTPLMLTEINTCKITQ